MPMAFETEPFNGDPHIGERIRELVAKHGVRTIVETGTYQGVTTLALACLVNAGGEVVSIEKNPKLFKEAEERGMFAPVYLLDGDSRERLPEVMTAWDGPFFFYLDAHWGADWPLLGELAAIADAGIKPVIVIHDFEVPGTDLGFDEYGGQRLDWEYVRESVERIYGPEGYVKTTNTPERAAGARRGVLYLEPRE